MSNLRKYINIDPILNMISDDTLMNIHYIKKFKKRPNICNPKSFAEKIHIIKLSNWLEDKKVYVDKYKVREIIKQQIGEEYLIKLYGVYEDVNKINFNDFPKSFVLKLNNGSGKNIIIKDKCNINELKLRKELNKWLKSDFYMKTREKQYKDIKQFILCEEYLEDESGELKDYKMFCFNGHFKFVQVDSTRFSNHEQNFYDRKWNKINMTYVCGKSEKIDLKPKCYEKMILLAEKLSQEFPFVRVDFYCVNNKIYFGELTFTPNNGLARFKPISKDLEIASWVNLDLYKI